jgi:hypothetical protein
LIIASVLLYLFHYAIFHDWHHIFIYLIGDIAFLPVEVLLVTLIIHRLLSSRERRIRLEKLNMVIGAFFSEVGTRLLAVLSDADPDLDDIKKRLIVTDEWSDDKFIEVLDSLKRYRYDVEFEKVELRDLHDFLMEKRNFLLRLLENPNMLEHELFTELLRAVFHLTEELSHRKKFKNLPKSDCEHLCGDLKRVYGLLVREWLTYMMYLKDNYPFLFSLALRTNPFDEDASPVVGGKP